MPDPTSSFALTSPHDLLGLVPYLLGFHPDNHVIVLFEQSDRRIRRGAQMCLDHSAEHIARDVVAAAARADDVACAWLIGYGRTSARDRMAAIAEVVDIVVPVADRFLVADGQYFCLRHGCGCAASEGQPFDARNTTAAATMTALGVVALPSRNHLLALVEPDPSAQAAISKAITALPAGFRPTSRDLHRLLARAVTGHRLTDEQAARLAVALRVPAVRAAAWLATDDRMWQRDLWLDLTRRLPEGFVTAAANLAAWCAWRRSEPDMAVAALDRARQATPGNAMSAVISALLRCRARPEDICWPPPAEKMAALRREASR